MHPIDKARSRLLRAGYSLGEVCCGARWIVEATGGGHTVLALAPGHRQAWLAALRLVEHLGVLVQAAEGQTQP